MNRKPEIPKGIAHLELIDTASKIAQEETIENLRRYLPQLVMIGTSLSALYQAATCHRKCHGGNHLLEALSGRVYNIGCAAYLLVRQGLYDEALNLLRSAGEVANLIMLSVVDKNAIREWIASDKKTRLAKYSPAKIRKQLEEKKGVLIANKDWYAKFCEEYTHVTPATKPNLHNEAGLPFVGGIYQQQGLSYSLNEIVNVLGSTAILICKYFDFDDLLEDLAAYVKSDSDGKPGNS